MSAFKIEIVIWYLGSHRGRTIEHFIREVHVTDAGLVMMRIAGGHGAEPEWCESCVERQLFAHESLTQSGVAHEWGEDGNILFFPQSGVQTTPELLAFLQRAFPSIKEINFLKGQDVRA